MSEPKTLYAPHDPTHDEQTRDGRCVRCLVSEVQRLDAENERLRAALLVPAPDALRAALDGLDAVTAYHEAAARIGTPEALECIDVREYNDAVERLIAAVRAALAPAPRAVSCPCELTTPCDPNCSCANPFLSGGCLRCCKYGSPEQQLAAAERLAQAPRAPAPSEAAKIKFLSIALGVSGGDAAWWLESEHRGKFATDLLDGLAAAYRVDGPGSLPAEGKP